MKIRFNLYILVLALIVCACTDNLGEEVLKESQSFSGYKIHGRINTDLMTSSPDQSKRMVMPSKGEYGDGSLIKYITYILYSGGKVIFDSRTSDSEDYQYNDGQFDIKIDKFDSDKDVYIFVWADAHGRSPESPYTIDADNHTVKVDYYKSIGTYDMADAFAVYKKIYDASTDKIDANIILSRPFVRFTVSSMQLRKAILEERKEGYEDYSDPDDEDYEEPYYMKDFETSIFFCPTNMMECSNLESALIGSQSLSCSGDIMECKICMLPDEWNFETDDVAMNKYGVITEDNGYDEYGHPLPYDVYQSYRLPSCKVDNIDNLEKQPFIGEYSWNTNPVDVGTGSSRYYGAIAYMAYLFAPPAEYHEDVDDKDKERIPYLNYFLNDHYKWPEEVVDSYEPVLKPTMEMCISRRAWTRVENNNGSTPSIGVGSHLLRVPFCMTYGLFNLVVGGTLGFPKLYLASGFNHNVHIDEDSNFTEIIIKSSLKPGGWLNYDFKKWE